MLDIKKIKENPDAVKAGLRAKEVDCDATVDRILELDGKIRALKTNTETQTAQKNKLAKENGKLFGMKKKAEKEGKDVSELDAVARVWVRFWGISVKNPWKKAHTSCCRSTR